VISRSEGQGYKHKSSFL